jgi:hypothetical protein
MSDTRFELPKYESATAQLVQELFRGFRRLDAILGQIQTVNVAHDGNTRQVSEPVVLETPIKQEIADSTFEAEWFVDTKVEKFRDFIVELSQRMHSSMVKSFLETVTQITDATGNSVESKGDIWEGFIEMIEKTEMTFDANGEHDYEIILNPETLKKLKENPPTPEQDKRMEEVIQRKREEHNAKKRTRRLS